MNAASQAPSASARTWGPQQEAIFEDARMGAGSTRITARAGTGKTTTIIEAASFLPREVSRGGVGFVAFNKTIASELQTRVPRGAQAMTMHSYGLRAVSRLSPRPQIEEGKLSRLVAELSTDREVRGCVRQIAALAKGSLAHTRDKIDVLIDEYGCDLPEGTTAQGREEVIALVRKVLVKSKSELGTIDFDDMIWLPAVLGLQGEKFGALFVDEAQDLNQAQMALVKTALAPGGRAFVVGDDRQAIYRFRGAGATALADLAESLEAKELRLTTTYRCPSRVVELARRLVPDYQAAPGAPLGTVENFTGYEAILKGARPGDFVLSRLNAPLISLCFQFLAQGTPCKVQGRDLGKKLTGMVRKLAGNNPRVTGFLQALDKWRGAEVTRLTALERPVDLVTDTADCLELLAEGLTDTKQLEEKVEALFTEKSSGEGGRLVLSSTHRAKGQERDRVWLLRDTYRPAANLEESNLYYVALTRTKKELYLVSHEVSK